MLRLFAGVILGYAIFALAAVLMFQIPGRDPNAPADPAFMVGTIGAGIIAASAGGYVGAAVAKGRERTAGLVIAVLIGGGALLSLVSEGAGASWSQLSAVFLAPSAYLASLIRSRRVRVR